MPPLSSMSNEPCSGEAPCDLANFKSPKLRKFPNPPSSLRWKRFLGAGQDGFVLSAKTTDNSLVAVKFFYDYNPPPQVPGLPRYWAPQRECVNAALLGMIKTSIRQMAECNRPIYLNPEPRTRNDAIHNLKAFSTERRAASPPSNWEPLDLSPQGSRINDCFGWLEMPQRDVITALENASWKPNQLSQLDRAQSDLVKVDLCFGIVYSFVPDGNLDADIIQQQLDFFHLVGFNLVPYREENWRAAGILVDFCDLIPLHCKVWWPSDYQKMDVIQYIAEQREWDERLRQRYEEIRRKIKETPRQPLYYPESDDAPEGE